MRDTTTLPHATVTLTPDGCYSTFADGTTWGAQPHATPHYDEIRRRCGYGTLHDRWAPDVAAAERMRYCREHDVLHHVVGDTFYGGPSPVLWALAHGVEPDPRAAALEEAMVMAPQPLDAGGEHGGVVGVDWDALRARCLATLDA